MNPVSTSSGMNWKIDYTAKRKRYTPLTYRRKSRQRTGYAPRGKAAIMPASGRAGRGYWNMRTAGLLGVELKFYDTSLVNATLLAVTGSTGGEHNPSATITLNSVTQGDGASSRDGRKIVMKNISLKGLITHANTIDQTALSPQIEVFVALVLDTQTNGVLLKSEDVFTNKGAAANMGVHPFNNMTNVPRFRILKRRTFKLGLPQAVYDGTNIEESGVKMAFDWYINLGNLVINYNAGITESIANIVDNSLNIIAWADQAEVKLSYNARMRFVG